MSTPCCSFGKIGYNRRECSKSNGSGNEKVRLRVSFQEMGIMSSRLGFPPDDEVESGSRVGFLANEAGIALIRNVREYDVKPNCIKRVGVSEDVVGTVAFLASDESAFITGQTILRMEEG